MQNHILSEKPRLELTEKALIHCREFLRAIADQYDATKKYAVIINWQTQARTLSPEHTEDLRSATRSDWTDEMQAELKRRMEQFGEWLPPHISIGADAIDVRSWKNLRQFDDVSIEIEIDSFPPELLQSRHVIELDEATEKLVLV